MEPWELHGLQYFCSRGQDNFFLSIYFISFSLDTGSRVGFAFKHRENKRIECIESLNPYF